MAPASRLSPAPEELRTFPSHPPGKLFTGDLGADVRAYPPFPGKEKEYLRAQIARIWACTTLCPKGKFEFDPEADPKEPGELPFGVKAPEDGAYMPLPAAAMLAPENWLCCYMRVLAIGRCTNPPKEEEEEEEDPDAPPKPKVLPPWRPPRAPLPAPPAALRQHCRLCWHRPLQPHSGGHCAPRLLPLRPPSPTSTSPPIRPFSGSRAREGDAGAHAGERG